MSSFRQLVLVRLYKSKLDVFCELKIILEGRETVTAAVKKKNVLAL